MKNALILNTEKYFPKKEEKHKNKLKSYLSSSQVHPKKKKLWMEKGDQVEIKNEKFPQKKNFE